MTAPLLVAVLQQDTQPWWLGLLALLFLVAFATSGYLLWHRRRRLDRRQDADDDEGPLPPLIFPPRPLTPGGEKATTATTPPSQPTHSPARAEDEDQPGRDRQASDDPAPPPGKPRVVSDSVRVAPTPIRFSLHAPEPDVTPPPASEAPEDHQESAQPAAHEAEDRDARHETDSDSPIHQSTNSPIHQSNSPVSVGKVRFHRPADHTLQLLPGRLEVLDESAGMHEIRFVRPAGNEPVITFGRTPGEPLEHVQLDAPTVSRLHARMHFHDGDWRIVNLSLTNPVVVNGVRLNGDSAADGKRLEDGDLVEMGEVSFRFRMP